MTNKVNLENNKQQKEHFAKVGERARELRLSHGHSIKKFEEMLELPSGVVHNIEHGKGGTGFNLLTIITFWANQGYSLKWMLNFDNESDFKKDDQHIYMEIDKAVLLELSDEFNEFNEKFKKTVDKYK